MSLSEEFRNIRIHPGRRGSPLSVNDLSDPGATSARKSSEGNSRDEQARFLIKAFKDFILPIVHTQGLGSAANRNKNANSNNDGAGLGPAAQQLVDALENFVTSLVTPEVIHKDDTPMSNIQENTGLALSVRRTVDSTQPKSLILRTKVSEKPRLLKLALDKARYRVFNKMPIRLLTFKRDGSGIKLLDRSATWDYVSTLVEAGFDEDQINEDIQRRSHKGYDGEGAEEWAIDRYISQYTKYAILSHTWLHDKPGEVTYGDWNSGKFDTASPGYQKLSNFCRIAATDHGHTLAWMDTICINKDSSAELDESIRSMFNWYFGASICITYLAQTLTLERMSDDMWFTRGWTLQELIAPRYMKFYGADWDKLCSDTENDKENYLIQMKILAATTITSDELNCTEWSPISRCMQWASTRQVTREEDSAYSLMGLFDVSFSIAYGEGAERAFFRLVQEILNSPTTVLDLINWGYGPAFMRNIGHSQVSSLIPSGPQQYYWRAAINIAWPLHPRPVTLTHLGLHVSVLLMPAISAGDPTFRPYYPIGDYYGSVTLDAAINDPDTPLFLPGQRYNILDRAIGDNTHNSPGYRHQFFLGVLNFSAAESFVLLPLNLSPCLAIALHFDPSKSKYPSLANAAAFKQFQMIRTRTAIVLDIYSRQQVGADATLLGWTEIPKKDLAQHGMQLLDMYL